MRAQRAGRGARRVERGMRSVAHGAVHFRTRSRDPGLHAALTLFVAGWLGYSKDCIAALSRTIPPTLQVKEVFVTQAEECVLAITTLKRTNSGSHKFKVGSFIVALSVRVHDAWQRARKPTHASNNVSIP